MLDPLRGLSKHIGESGASDLKGPETAAAESKMIIGIALNRSKYPKAEERALSASRASLPFG
jgi:hypothetical protein